MPVCCVLATLLTMLAGCGSSGPQGGPRVETLKVTGLIHVDGQPVSYLRVSAIPDGNAAVPQTPSALTTPDGKFELSTYESGDGIPPGDYKLTFAWGEISLMSGQYTGDKLKGKYSKPENSQYTISVKAGDKPLDMGIIELTSK